ncbi:beta-galactosidase [Streptomyces sp. KL116D]|uniref:beta-galactosidase n=1 Tax=Streptomyces sp. KL116D TaxID=3045152 RepID=UPI0035571E26
MGLNCVETTVPWNLHEPRPGEVADVAAVGRFLGAAQERRQRHGLIAARSHLCRVGRTVGCLALADSRSPGVAGSVRVTRSSSRRRGALVRGAAAVHRGAAGGPKGGPVIMVQVESEYGSYGSDHLYLRAVADLLVELGVTVPLFTSDRPGTTCCQGVRCRGPFATVNFGSRARARASRRCAGTVPRVR